MVGEKILIVDDSILICGIVERELSNNGFIISKAYNGDTALKLIKEIEPSLVLLDVTLPDTDGYSICEVIKNDSLTCDIPIIFLTSNEDDESIVKAFRAGAIDYISKPFSVIELNVRVKAHLENKKIRDRLKETNTELEKALIENKRLAYTDSLTGLYNRHYFLENIENLIDKSRRNNKKLWIALFDIDDFKNINDVYGHCHGDCVLAKIAAIIDKNSIDDEISCRWGGEEFISIIYGIDENEIEQKIQNICKEVFEYNFKYNDENIHCTLTVGISQFNHLLNIDENIALSDEAMYCKKRNGKNGYYINKIEK